jgi:hypothetical protein
MGVYWLWLYKINRRKDSMLEVLTDEGSVSLDIEDSRAAFVADLFEKGGMSSNLFSGSVPEAVTPAQDVHRDAVIAMAKGAHLLVAAA